MTPKYQSSSGKCISKPSPSYEYKPDAPAAKASMEPSQSRIKKLRNNKTSKKLAAESGVTPADAVPEKAATSVIEPPVKQAPKGVPTEIATSTEALEVDDMSNVSTATSLTPDTMAEEEWTNIVTKKKPKPRAGEISTGSSDVKAQSGDMNNSSQSHSSQDARRDRGAPRPTYPGSPKGLPFFRRIDVGIEDDKDFRVVQRLIGPRGKYTQDITERCRGSKIWIIGKGSRSREDSVGPLMICVGATSLVEFDSAVEQINELLAWVHKEHRRFHRM